MRKFLHQGELHQHHPAKDRHRDASLEASYLSHGQLVVDDQCKDGTRDDQKEVPEGILLLVIGLLDLLVIPHVPQDGEGTCQEDELHHGVVK